VLKCCHIKDNIFNTFSIFLLKFTKRIDKKRNVNYSNSQDDALTKQSDKALNEKSKGE